LTGLQQARVEGDPEDVEAAIARYLTIHASAFAMGGMPLLYSGDEIGQTNDYSYLTDPIKAQDNRWVHRPEMDWEAVGRRQDEGSVEQRVFDGVKRLTNARKDLQALHHRADERVLDVDNDQVFVVERVHDGERLLAVSNVSASGQAIDISMLPDAWHMGRFRDVLADEHVCFPNGRLLVEPYGHLWLEPSLEAIPRSPTTTAVSIDVEAEWGERVFLTGSHEALGEWDVEGAVPLDVVDFPTWEGTVELPENVVVECEWLRKRDGQARAWSGHRYAIRAGTGDIWRLD
jgi:amylosucrase